MKKLYTLSFLFTLALFLLGINSNAQSTDLSVMMSVNNPNAPIGSSVVFTIIAQNNGPNNDTGVIVSAILTSGFTFVSSSAAVGSYNNATGIWAIGNSSIGVSQALTITALVNATGNHNFTACIQGNLTDINPSNNCNSISISQGNNNIIYAVDDYVSTPFGVTTTLLTNVLINDTLNNVPASTSTISLSTISSPVPEITLNNSTGDVSITAIIPDGTYVIIYQICEIANPTHCDVANLYVYVQSDLNANDDDMSNFPVNSTNGNASVVNVFANDTLNGYPLNPANIVITIVNPATNAGVILDFTTGNVSVLPNTPNGIYYITYIICEVANPNNCDTANVTIVVGNITDRLKLIAFYDTNNNGIKDVGEIDCNNGYFVSQLNNSTNSFYYGNNVNIYHNNPTDTYNLSYITYNSFDVCSTTYTNISIALGSGETTYYFPVTSTPYTDVGIYISTSNPVPGFNQNCYITYRNNGNQVVPSGTITFTKDAALSISSITQTGTVATPTGFAYDFTNLLPGQNRYISVYLQVPTIPTVSLGQLVTNSVSITPTDSYLANNSSSSTRTIVGAYDPNDITEVHGEEIVHSTFTSNDYLTYTIRFENTGTANAITVKVDDVLDSKLDETSVRMIGSSDANILERVGSNLTWTFDDIQLPPSIPNSQTGHGFIVFEVKPKTGYAIGDIIPNTANIFFDFNPAIVTNTWNTEFVTALNSESFAYNGFTSYPNPVKDNLFVSNNSKIDTIEIISTLGQKVISKNCNSLSTEIDLSGISKGIYFVKIKSNNQEKTIKIIKE